LVDSRGAVLDDPPHDASAHATAATAATTVPDAQRCLVFMSHSG
jgi:hypothetical protein